MSTVLPLPGAAALVAAWPAAQRLYTLSGDGAIPELLVESFTATEAVSEPFVLHLDVLSLNARLDLPALLRRPVTLHTVLADGSRSARSGLVMEASSRDANGGFAGYRLVVQPFIALLGFCSHSRSWQGKTLPQIVDDVMQPLAGVGAWQWGEVDEHGSTENLAGFLARGPHGGVYPFCVQYRETDLDFVQRLLVYAGMGWRVQQDEGSPSGHRIVFFADSYRWPQNPSSASALGGAGLRFQRSAATEEQDAVQAFGGLRLLQPGTTTTLHWDPRAKRGVAASVPTHLRFAGPELSDRLGWLELYAAGSAEQVTGEPTTWDQAQHRARLLQEGLAAANKTWLLRCTVRSLRPGQWFLLTQSTLDRRHPRPEERQFGVLRVNSLGINNLPRELSEALARTIGAALDDVDCIERGELAWLDSASPGSFTDPASPLAQRRALIADAALRRQAQALGYACRAEAIRRQIPWRPLPPGWEHGEPPFNAAVSLGLQTARVVGPDGSLRPSGANGADELYTDGRGRVKIRFHWQSADGADPRGDNPSSCWVRVAQGWAGPGTGHQFLPRIGQEVLVSFIGDDMALPIVTHSLYNGRGEGGVPRTPGGRPAAVDNAVFALSSDHRAAGQANLASGNSPAWHGAAPGEARPGAPAQNNAAALSGLKSKEFGSVGFSQLVYDDTPNQLRVQYATTQHATQLNLGHLVHQADNHRGSFRGKGLELRSDAYGALRGARGVLIATYVPKAAEPAGDNVAGTALLKQAAQLTDSFSQAARTHETTQLAGSLGSIKPNQSVLSDREAPMKALLTAASGMVDAVDFNQALQDAADRNTQVQDDKLPHSTDPLVTLVGRAGLAVVAGQDIQL
ncbi:MAG TPA: type VI secretion system Vgr family protein, partial [Ideonella sp.]|nr:type VI secretion system Vgr family protein [Ideonella sp.]